MLPKSFSHSLALVKNFKYQTYNFSASKQDELAEESEDVQMELTDDDLNFTLSKLQQTGTIDKHDRKKKIEAVTLLLEEAAWKKKTAHECNITSSNFSLKALFWL